jgi:APA family basic amino acid/polyamine antiporter
MGFENITRLSPETVDAKKTVPKAVILSILITVVIYILVGIAAVSAVPWDELAASDAPLAMIAERAFGEESFILLSLIALFSTFNTIIGMLLGASRIVFGMAQERALPQFFSVTSKKLKTPWVATMVIIGCAMCFSFFRNLETVANLANFAVFTVFILVNSSLIYLRYTKPVEEGFKVPFCIGKMPVIPLLGVVTAIFMIFNLTLDVFFMGIILIVLGMLFFGVLHKFGKKHMRLTGRINSFKLPFEK